MENLRTFVELVGAFAAEQGLSPATIAEPELELAVEEALVNVFRYAYRDREGDAAVACRRDRSGKMIEVEITDWGTPFNPLKAPPPDLTPILEERRIGGLGILLIEELADEVRYRRDGNRNILSIRFALDREKK
jgi:anti-sigma regulatory factor (Ser/Thr protein kinase)